MSSFALSNLAAQTRASVQGAGTQKRIANTFRRRWIHNNMLRKQAIMMPALSPFATEGTITRWKVQEGQTFNSGDVLLQIENDTGVCDVEACSDGIMGKILTPCGTEGVPVEAVIAIVARNPEELTFIQAQSMAPTPPPFIQTPRSPSTIGASSPTPRQLDFKLPAMMSPRTPTMSPRTPSLFEKQMMARNAHVGGPRGAPKSPSALRLDLAPHSSCPASPKTQAEIDSGFAALGTAHTPLSATYAFPRSNTADEPQIDGASLRRMILANLTAKAKRNPEVEDLA